LESPLNEGEVTPSSFIWPLLNLSYLSLAINSKHQEKMNIVCQIPYNQFAAISRKYQFEDECEFQPQLFWHKQNNGKCFQMSLSMLCAKWTDN
jgi:hypothetical protein